MFSTEKKVITVILQKIKNILMDELIAVVVFGSRVRGDFHDTSDFDILIIVKKKSFSLLLPPSCWSLMPTVSFPAALSRAFFLILLQIKLGKQE